MAEPAHINHDTAKHPAWGTLGLDVFFLEKWRFASELPDHEQRHHLIHTYLSLGHSGRHPYILKAAINPPQPTSSQMSQILLPLRPPALRNFICQSDVGDDFIWLNIDYPPNKDAHAEFFAFLPEVDAYENLTDDGTILSDSRFYNFGDDWRKVLDVLPEILDPRQHDPSEAPVMPDRGRHRRKLEREYMTALSSNKGEMVAKAVLERQQHSCVARLLVVEDKETHTTDERRMLAVWLDEYGNVVRESRVTPQAVCDYLSIVGEAMGPENEDWLEAIVGPKYVQGAEFGPPFKATDEAVTIT